VTNVVNHVGLCVTDPVRSRWFYEQVFGVTHRNELKPPDGLTARLLQLPAPIGATAIYLELDGFVLERVNAFGSTAGRCSRTLTSAVSR
jgi:hypothetical protein